MQFRPKQTVNAILANLLSMKTGWKQPLRKREIKMSRIQQTFAALDGAKALIPYITVGDPDLDTTLALMHSLVENGADILEWVFPFPTRWQTVRPSSAPPSVRWQTKFPSTTY